MSDGVGEARAEAEGELALARIALSEREFAHAAAHLGSALAADPSLPSVYQTLHELDAAAGGALTLFPVEPAATAGTVAARSYLLARSGAPDAALGLLCLVVAEEPGKPWAAPGWLHAPGLAALLDPQLAASALLELALSLPDPADPHLVAGLTPFLDLARGVIAANSDHTGILGPLSALARRLGAYTEAITWCERAERAEASANAAIMLGYALRGAGRFGEMHEAWLRALSRDPGNVELRVDIAEQLAARGRRAEGIGWLEQGLELAPGHPKAFPSVCEMRYAEDGDIAHLVRLADWWREHPEHGYADKMLAKACYDRPWLGMVPRPTEAICNVLLQLAGKYTEPGQLRQAAIKMTLSALEVPSAIAAARTYVPGIRIAAIQAVPEPDIRVPLRQGQYRVWAYAGTEAHPAVPAPSPAAVTALRTVAAGGHQPHPIAAYDAAVALAGLPAGDLLGLLAHVPPVPDLPEWQDAYRADPAYWPRFAQTWACLGLLHHRSDEPWASSVRRSVLLDLVTGAEDWTTDAAAYAMVVAAWLDPGIRDDVAGIVGHRFLDAVRAFSRREVTIVASLAQLILVTPAMIPDVTALARDLLARIDREGGEPPPPAGNEPPPPAGSEPAPPADGAGRSGSEPAPPAGGESGRPGARRRPFGRRT